MGKRERLTDRQIRAKEMLTEVFLRNKIAMYRDLNREEYKIAAVPRVGIFWYDISQGKIFSRSSSLRDAEDFAGNKIHRDTHYETWRSVQRENPKWKGMEYEDVPRGRVVYEADPKKPMFVVYLPKELSRVKSKIQRHFNIPSGHVRFEQDEHYELW